MACHYWEIKESLRTYARYIIYTNSIKYHTHMYIYIYRDPLDWYIYLHEWLILLANVGKYIPVPMDPMGTYSRQTRET